MFRFRLSEAAQGDILSILAWSHARFGEFALLRDERLIVTAQREVANDPDRPGSLARPGLGAGDRQTPQPAPSPHRPRTA